METRTALRKSVLIAPIEKALECARDQSDLEDIWFDLCDGFADDSAERAALLAVYMRVAQRFKGPVAVVEHDRGADIILATAWVRE